MELILHTEVEAPNPISKEGNKNLTVRMLRMLRCSPLTGGWTESGREVQTLSSLCPVSVQTLSKINQSTRFVQTLDNQVQALSRLWTQSTRSIQTLDSQVQGLSRLWTTKSNPMHLDIEVQTPSRLWTCIYRICPTLVQVLSTYRMDIVWTWTNTGQRLGLDK